MWIVEAIFWVALLLVGFGVHEALELPSWLMPIFVIPAFVFGAWRLETPLTRTIVAAVMLVFFGLATFLIDLLPFIDRGFWLIAVGVISLSLYHSAYFTRGTTS